MKALEEYRIQNVSTLPTGNKVQGPFGDCRLSTIFQQVARVGHDLFPLGGWRWLNICRFHGAMVSGNDVTWGRGRWHHRNALTYDGGQRHGEGHINNKVVQREAAARV